MDAVVYVSGETERAQRRSLWLNRGLCVSAVIFDGPALRLRSQEPGARSQHEKPDGRGVGE